MMKFAVIGHPLTQSLSSVMHNAMLKDLGIDGTYELLDTEQEDLVTRVKQLKSQGYTGFNVTIPLKVPITLFLDEFDNLANLAGCANTVKINEDKSLSGYNTDIYGFKTAIPSEIQSSLEGNKVSILGTGGASGAILNVKISQINHGDLCPGFLTGHQCLFQQNFAVAVFASGGDSHYFCHCKNIPSVNLVAFGNQSVKTRRFCVIIKTEKINSLLLF